MHSQEGGDVGGEGKGERKEKRREKGVGRRQEVSALPSSI
jgi:hypothetical protein